MLMMYVFASAVPAAWWARMRLTGEESGEKGATATEYAILVGFIAVAIVGGVTAFGTALDGYYTDITAAVSAALNP
ncbi:Flp family type IVb pilin [Arthrobacter sp. STN4]|uniref:Flp family type IVb pilin n=1 Tax=Arthrobacter sp. STN4 TaxID=2923276 RepID=UPI002119DA9D|nr:Flp family type IVb pilin [Arthrobacter sp. STN4]MCQ9163601.1 Flp family type IVb pilin [Arthrobacter sp. STN4]